MTVEAQSWSPASHLDTDFYWLSLYRQLATDDEPTDPAVSITEIDGDPSPPIVTDVILDTGDRAVIIPPGIEFTDPGPRIQMTISGGTAGYTYDTNISWTTTEGRTINRIVKLPIQW